MTLIADVSVSLDRFALDVRLELPRGETVALVGPNGAGKTTLLRVIGGLLPLRAGRITLDDRVLDEPATGAFVPPEERSVGMVFQDALLFPHLRAVDNVAFGLRARGVARTDARQAAVDWLARVGLAGRESARPAELSGGQGQRVALARALAIEPAVLLLDEPLAALDATTRNEVRRDLLAYLRAFAGVRVVVTHDPVDAAALADRVVVIEDGVVTQEGTPIEIISRPRTPWVADLAGTNLLRGRAEGAEVTIAGGGTLVTADAQRGDVLLAVHPHGVAVHLERPHGSPRNVWSATVAELEPLGERVRVRLDGPPAIVAELTASAATELALEQGSRVWASVKATELQVYPAT